MASVRNDGDKSTSELTSDLLRQVSTLVRDEFALARAEMTQKGKRAAFGAGMFGAAGMFGLLGLVCVTGCVVAAIAIVLPVWSAALIVGGAYLLLAGVVAAAGRVEVQTAAPPVPTEAAQSAREDVEWIKTQSSSSSR